MARPDPASDGVPEARHEPVVAGIFSCGVVLHPRGLLGNDPLLNLTCSYGTTYVVAVDSSNVDRHPRGFADRIMQALGIGHKPSP